MRRVSASGAARWRVRIPPEGLPRAGSSPAGRASARTPEMGNALSTIATNVGGLLAICWQQASQQGPKRLFALVGVTGIEPVTSAV
jgi:hypothetical protein